MNEPTLTTAEVAAELACSRQNVNDLIRRGRLLTAGRGPNRTHRVLASSVTSYATERDLKNAEPDGPTTDATTKSSREPDGDDPEPLELVGALSELTERVALLEQRLNGGDRPDGAAVRPPNRSQSPAADSESGHSAATFLAVSISVQDELRNALAEADLTSDLLSQAVQASLRSKSALQRADEIRDRAIRDFGYPAAPPHDM